VTWTRAGDENAGSDENADGDVNAGGDVEERRFSAA
jgi:hypothetical protein